ncbi:MAG: immunoglobulin domain-containing protein, partial [Verrucomicrobiota bacterium]
MRTFVVVLSCLASGAFLLPVLAQSAFTLTPLSSFGPNGDGSLRPGDQFYVTTDFAQRGVAYNPKTGNIIFVDRAAGGGGSPDISGGIYVLNGVTGEDVGSLSVNGMGGGAFADLAVGVADDGVVYVGNLVTDGTTSPFKLYRWPSDSTLDDPVLVFSGDPGNGKPQRWGDTMDIRGVGASTQILLGTRPAGGNAGTYVAILTTLDGVNFTATTLSTDVTDGASGGGIAFGAGDTFWAKNLDVPLRQFRFDLATGLAQTMHSFGGDVLPASRNLEPLAVDVGKNLLGIVEMVSGVDRVRLYDIADLSKAPVLLDMKDFAVDFQNGTTTKGYLDFGGDRLYVHNMNNGLQNYSIVSAPLSSPTIVNHPASERVLAGRPVRLEVLAFPAATYQWQRNGIDIPDATAPVFSLSDPKATDSGIYRVVVSNAAGSVPSDEAILTVVEPAQIFHLTPIWATPPAADSYVTSTGGQNTPNERGFAYDPASDKVFVVQRGGSTSANYTIHVVDGTTGNKLHTLLTNGITTVVVSEVPGANGIGLVAIDVAEDGAIYACNASPNAAGGSSFSENKLFRVYRWANSSPETLPVQVFSGDPAQQTGNFRWGDVLEVRGGGLNTQIVLDNQNAAARFLAILTPTDATMSAFISRYFLQDTADPFGTSIGRSIEFGEGNTVWQKRKAAALIQSSFDFNANPNISPKLAAHTGFPASLGQVALDRSRNLLAGINYATSTSVPDTLDLYEVSDLSDPLLVGSYRFPVNHINNNNFIGRVLFAGDRVYALNGNNGMVAFRIVAGASSPPAILKQPESKRLVTGSSASLNVIVAEEARFQWQFNEKDLAGANSATYTIANAKLTDAGRYRVIVSNDAGSTISSNAVVTVLPAENFHQLAPLWKLAPLEREYLREDTDGQGRTPYYRTLGYHRARNQIYLITRSSAAGGLAVNVLNATTGEHLHELDVSTVFGGSIILVAIGVAEDGAIYASNMDTSG